MTVVLSGHDLGRGDLVRVARVLATALGSSAERAVKQLEMPWTGLPTGLSSAADASDAGLSYLGIAVQSTGRVAEVVRRHVPYLHGGDLVADVDPLVVVVRSGALGGRA